MTKKGKKGKAKKVISELMPYQDEEKLKEMYPKMTAGEISRKFNVSRSVVLYYLKKFGIKITTRVSPHTGPKFFKKDANRSYRKKKWLEAQLEEGLSMYKISVICKVGFGNIRRYVDKFNLGHLVEEQRTKAKETQVTEQKPKAKKAKSPAPKKKVKKLKAEPNS